MVSPPDVRTESASRCVHDHGDSEQAYRRSHHVPAVRLEPVHDHPPHQRTGHEDAAIGGHDPTEMSLWLQRHQQAVPTEDQHPGTHPEQAPILSHALPYQPRSTDLGNSGNHEEQDRSAYCHIGRTLSLRESRSTGRKPGEGQRATRSASTLDQIVTAGIECGPQAVADHFEVGDPRLHLGQLRRRPLL